jgi:hypothetical protein
MASHSGVSAYAQVLAFLKLRRRSAYLGYFGVCLSASKMSSLNLFSETLFSTSCWCHVLIAFLFAP